MIVAPKKHALLVQRVASHKAHSDAGFRAGHSMSRCLGRTSAAHLPVAGLKGLSML